MKKLVVLFALTAIAVGAVYGQEKTTPDKKKEAAKEMMTKDSWSWEGYLADAKCGTKMVGEKGEARAMRHTQECALMDDCKASGYGLVTGGKYVKFTKEGDGKAVAFLEKSEMENDIFVKVSGRMDGDMIVVSSIEAAKKVKKVEKKM